MELREFLFRPLENRRYRFSIRAREEDAPLGCDRLLAGLAQGLEPGAVVEFIAAGLRERWHGAMH